MKKSEQILEDVANFRNRIEEFVEETMNRKDLNSHEKAQLIKTTFCTLTATLFSGRSDEFVAAIIKEYLMSRDDMEKIFNEIMQE